MINKKIFYYIKNSFWFIMPLTKLIHFVLLKIILYIKLKTKNTINTIKYLKI